MRNRNFMIFVFFIMALFLVPNRVMADHPRNGKITCSYTLIYPNVNMGGKYKIDLNIMIDPESDPDNWLKTEWVNDSNKRPANLLNAINRGYATVSTIFAAEEFVSKGDWTCPKISYGIRDDGGGEGNYYIKVATKESWEDNFNKDFKDLDNAVTKIAIEGKKSNYKPATNNPVVDDDETETCRFVAKYGSKEHDILIEINHTKSSMKFYVDNRFTNAIEEYQEGCPEKITYCVMNPRSSDFILPGENKNCEVYLSENKAKFEGTLDAWITTDKKGKGVVFDADGNANAVGGERGETDLVDGVEKEEAEQQAQLEKIKVPSTCEGILGEDVIEIINDVLGWIQILAPILLILFGSLDFAKAVIANDDNALKKATSDFGKRAIAAVAVFLVPFIVRLVLGLEGVRDALGNTLCEGIGKVVIK